MSSRLLLISCLSAMFCVPASWGSQVNSEVNIGVSPPVLPVLPVAHVYVASTPANSGSNQIDGFAAGLDGRLTPIFNSPYS